MGTVLLSVIIDTTNKKHNQEISGARSTSSRTDCKGKCITPEEHTAMFFYHYFSSASQLDRVIPKQISTTLSEMVKSNLPEIQTCVCLQEQVQLKQSLTPDHTLRFQLNPHKLFSIPNLHKKKKKEIKTNIIYHYSQGSSTLAYLQFCIT